MLPVSGIEDNANMTSMYARGMIMRSLAGIMLESLKRLNSTTLMYP